MVQFFLGIDAARIIFALGIINLLTAGLIYSSCRSVPGLTRWLQKPGYKNFYKYHKYLWWVLWPSIIVHAFLAIGRYLYSIGAI